MVNNPCGFCGMEVKPEDDCVMVGLNSSGIGRSIIGHRVCASSAKKGPKNPAHTVECE